MLDIEISLKIINKDFEEPLTQYINLDVENIVVLESEFDTVFDHIINALRGIGYNNIEKMIKEYIDAS